MSKRKAEDLSDFSDIVDISEIVDLPKNDISEIVDLPKNDIPKKKKRKSPRKNGLK